MARNSVVKKKANNGTSLEILIPKLIIQNAKSVEVLENEPSVNIRKCTGSKMN